MNGFIKRLLEIADLLGVIDSFCTYSADFISVDGRTRDDKKKFSISIHLEDIKEEETDGN